MTSLARETGRDDLTVVRVLPDVANAFATTFGREIEWQTREALPHSPIPTQTS